MIRRTTTLISFVLISCAASGISAAQDPGFVWFNAWGSISAETISVTEDSSGDILSAGYFYWSDDLDPGLGTANFSGQGMQAYVTKFDADGNHVWSRVWDDPNTSYGADFAASVAVDSNDNVLVFGYYEGTIDFDAGPQTANRTASLDGHCFLVKLAADGAFQWVRTLDESIPPSGGYPRCLRTDSEGNALAVSTAATKISPDGNIVWNRVFNGTQPHYFNSVDFDRTGKAFLAGSFSGSLDSDPGPGVASLSSAGGEDILLIELDQNGNYIWSTSLGGSGADSIVSLAMGPYDDLHATGYFSGTVDFDAGPGVATLSSPVGSNIFAFKLGSGHQYRWAHSYGDPATTGNSLDYRGSDVVVDDFGSVYVTGNFLGSVFFGPGQNSPTLSGSPYLNFFVLKLTAWGDCEWVAGTASRANAIWLDQYDTLTIGIAHPGMPVDYDVGSGTFIVPAMSVPAAGLLKLSQTSRTVPLNRWSLFAASLAISISSLLALKRNA